jgi:beta-lactamase regulating signal transducer with metallopeptidase domain
VIVKVTLLFALALVATLSLRRAAAATRHALLAAAQIAALALPLLPSFVPVPVPASQEVLNVGRASARPRVIRHDDGGGRAEARPTFTHVWLVGFLIVSGTKIVSLVRALAVVRRAKDGYSDEVEQPMTLGSRILLPCSARSWSEERLQAVLLHESAHVRRRDTLLGLAGELACAVYWFHPLAWLVERRARLERERACDDAVLAAGVAPGDYASAIVEVARASRRPAMAMPMAAPSQLETRITAILDPKVARKGSRAAAVLVLALAPALAALEADIPRPRFGEPDLRNDSPPQSELLPSVGTPRVEATGRDAAFIAFLLEEAARPPRDNIDYVPERARWALSKARDGVVVEPLLDALHDRDWRVRAYAAWALGYSGDTRATAPLIAMLQDGRWRIRAMAAHALANLGDPAAEEAMLRAVGDEAWQVRSGVARYLGVRGTHRRTLEALRKDRHVAVRDAAEEVLR